jgi:hypothetical protein
MAKIKFPTIPNDAIIDIQVSGSFYRRLVDLLTELGNTKPVDEFKAILEKLKTNEGAKDAYELNVHLVMMLIYEIEKKAFEQKKTKEEEIEVPDETTDSSPQQDPQSAQ